MSRNTPFFLLAALSLAACTVGPDYARPSVEIPAAFKEAGSWKVGEPRDHLPRGKWWEIFGDPLLNELQEQVTSANQNVRIAEAQFRQARALAQASQAGAFPSVSGGLSAARSHASSAGQVATSHTFSLSASWEADLWGRVRRQVEAGEAGAQASAADLEAVRLSAHAAMAQNYLLLRSADTQKRLLDDTVAAYEKSLQLIRNRYAAGVAARVDVIQAQTQLKATQAQSIDLGVQRAQLEHAIAVLCGKTPASFAIATAPNRVVFPAIPTGVPSELLERRPDIAAAERRMAAANAQIGIAKSAFFPSLTLSASGGYQSESLANWLTLPNRVWSLGPAIAQNLFDGGLRRAQNEQALAAFDASVAAYRLAVLGGFLEVEDNLAALRILEQEAGVQDEALQAARESLALTINQYKAGTVGYLNVVAAQATALAGERVATDIRGRRLNAGVLLVKALGGGWQMPAPGDEGLPALR